MSATGTEARVPDDAIDRLTVIAIAVVAYAAANVLHEGLGHGGACLLVHGRPMVWSAVHFDCDLAGLGPTAGRIVAAGGTVVNLAASAVAWWWLARRAPRSSHGRFLLWLFATINLLQGTGYFLFSGVADIGDWVIVMQGLMPEAAWRALLSIVGGATYWLATMFAIRRLDPFLSTVQPARFRGAAQLSWTAYLSGGALYCVAGLLNPVSMWLVAISAAAASLGGTSGLAWGSQYLRAPAPAGAGGGTPLPIRRSPVWIVVGAALAALFVSLLGPGIRFH
jgi:hypothetical protein